MGTSIVPFDSTDKLPAYLQQERKQSINQDVTRAAAFPTLSIKGKVFTLKKDGQKRIITKPNEPDEVAQSLGVVILRSNLKASVFYAKKFSEGDSDGAVPDCYTHDGVTPSVHATNPQSKKCATCPHRVWGSRVSDGDRPGDERKGRACSDQGRLAIAAPDKLEDAMLLRVPPASLKNLREAVKIIDARKYDYNMVVMKVSFDPEAASPTLKFKPVGLLGDADYAKASELYDSEIVRAIVGVDDEGHGVPAEPAEGPVSSDELDAAIAARKATEAAKQASAPAPAPVAEAPAAAPRKARSAPKVDPDEIQDAAAAAPAPAPAPKPSAPPAASGGSLVDELDDLLGSTDD